MLILQCIYCHMCSMSVRYSMPNIELMSQIRSLKVAEV